MSVLLLAVVIAGGKRNVPHVMQIKSDQFGGSVLTISPALTFALLLFNFFAAFLFCLSI